MSKKGFIIITCIVISILLILTICKFIMLVPVLFQNSDLLDKENNQQVKEIIIESIKKRHSFLSTPQNKSLYSEKVADTDNYSKGLFVIINGDFMKSCKKIGDDKYSIEVNLYSPDDWKYYFTVQELDGQYTVLSCEIDP